jgi:hypothetical protein
MLQARRLGAALCAARLVALMPARAPTPVSWRERPREMAAWPAKPAATDVVAHAAPEQAVGVRVGIESPPACAEGSNRSGEQVDESLSPLLSLVARAVVTRVRGADLLRDFAHFSTNILPRIIGHHMTRIELC